MVPGTAWRCPSNQFHCLKQEKVEAGKHSQATHLKMRLLGGCSLSGCGCCSLEYAIYPEFGFAEINRIAPAYAISAGIGLDIFEKAIIFQRRKRIVFEQGRAVVCFDVARNKDHAQAFFRQGLDRFDFWTGHGCFTPGRVTV